MGMLDGKVVLVTGSTDGHGRALARELLAEGATVLVHGRDPERLAGTSGELAKYAAADRVRCYQADLASLSGVRSLADQVTAAEPRLDVLVSNAGVGFGAPGGEREESADSFELRFAVNYLAGYALTRLLLPLLTASAPSRVVSVASIGQQAIDFDDVMLTKGYDGARAYRQSKLAQVMDAFTLAEEIAGTGVTISSLHPATFMPTKMVTGTPLSTVADGVTATMRQVTAPAAEVSGRFFNGLDEARANEQAYDPAARRELRELSAKLTGL